MEQNNIHLTECDDLQITSHLNVEALPQFLQDLLSELMSSMSFCSVV